MGEERFCRHSYSPHHTTPSPARPPARALQVKIEKNDSEVIRKLKLQPIRGITKSTNIQQKKGEKEFLLELFEFSRKNTYYCNEADENAVEVDTPRRSRP